jgi:hypothetical protein
MKLRLATAFALTLGSTATFAASDSNNFVLLNKGKVIGKAAYTIAKIKEGYRVNTHYQYRVSPGDISAGDPAIANSSPKGTTSGLIEGQISAEYRVSPEGDLLGGFITDATTQMITGFTPSKDRNNMTVGVSQAGISGQPANVPMPQPAYALVPSFDPAALQMLLTTAIAHPHADSKYLMVVPSMTPRGGPTTAWLSFQPASATDATGTLDAKPVTLKHYTFKFYSGTAELYTDEPER